MRSGEDVGEMPGQGRDVPGSVWVLESASVAFTVAFSLFLLLASQTSTVQHGALAHGHFVRWQTTITQSLYQKDGRIIVVLALVPPVLCGVVMVGTFFWQRGVGVPIVPCTIVLGCVLIAFCVLSLILVAFLLAAAGGCLLAAAGILAGRQPVSQPVPSTSR